MLHLGCGEGNKTNVDCCKSNCGKHYLNTAQKNISVSRMPISYAAALRMLAKEKGHFVLPTKGSADYDKVRKLMAETEMSAEHEVKKRVSKKMKEGAKEKPLVTGTDAPPPMKVDTKILDNPPASEVKEKKVKNAAKEPVASAKGGVKRSGRTKAEEVKDFLINDNTGPSSVITTENPDQKKALKKVLKKKDTPLSPDPKPSPPEKTIDMMNKEASGPSLDGEKQFSFIEFRKKLLC